MLSPSATVASGWTRLSSASTLVASAVPGSAVASKLTFVGSGWLGIKEEPGPLSGEVKIVATPSGSVELVEGGKPAGIPQNLVRWLKNNNPNLPREEIWGSNRTPTGDGFAELYLIVNRLKQAVSGYLLLESFGSGPNERSYIRVFAGEPDEIRFGVGTSEELILLDAGGKSNLLQLDAKRKERDFGLVTELPASPVKGDRCKYVADSTNGVIWDLVYDGEGSFPWKKIGGPPLYAFSNAERTLTNKVAFESLPTDPLKITAPLKGDYDIRIEVAMVTTTLAGQGLLSYAIGATAANDNWAASFLSPAGATAVADVSKTTRQLAVAAAANIEEKGRTAGNYGVGYARRRLTVDPVRVG